jgi:translation elongation factor EF-Tu-like GTPase
MEKRTTDFIAVLKYHAAEEDGRSTPAYSGYRPHVKFDFEEMQTSGQQVFIGKETVLPGDTVTAEITIASPKIFKNQLSCGMVFEFREGAKIIGTGRIIKILNSELNTLNNNDGKDSADQINAK